MAGGKRVAGRPRVPPVRVQVHLRLQALQHAILLLRVRQALQRQDRHGHGTFPNRLPKLGHGHIPARHPPQGHIQRAAGPGSENKPELGVVPAAQAQGGVAHPGGAGPDVRPRRGGRGVSGRAREEQARRQEGQEEEDGGRGHQGQGDRNNQGGARAGDHRGPSPGVYRGQRGSWLQEIRRREPGVQRPEEPPYRSTTATASTSGAGYTSTGRSRSGPW